jgi:pimeloyl-ACP methyl ester carboxylesterase
VTDGIFPLNGRYSRVVLAFPAAGLILFLTGLADASVTSFDIAAPARKPVSFFVFLPSGISRDSPILLLVPGYNGSGREMLDAGWTKFAQNHGVVLLSPTFETSLAELQAAKGYYYPEQWSGAVVEEALRELGLREGIVPGRILIFGMSAGAHFAHRFALWKPERVKAFVAYSAGWWSDPTEKLAGMPALIMCGENDLRYEATRTFFEKALALELPWVWRSYRHTGHEMTPAARQMAEAFLAYYAKWEPPNARNTRTDAEGGTDATGFWGDVQTYRFVGEEEKEGIPPAVRVWLPSREVAEIWAKEE